MFILDLVEVCGSPELAHILGIIKRVLNLFQIIGPIVGIIGLILALIKLMMNPDEKKLKNSIRNWVIAIVMLFLLPVIINLVVGLFDDSFQLSECWNYSNQKSTSGKSNYVDDDDNDKNDKTNFFSGTVGNNQTYSSSGSSSSSSGSSQAQSTNNSISKRIFIGDSRTVGMQTAVGSSTDTWSCLVGAGLKWLKETGFPNVKNKINTGSAVIILMGVNDLYNVSNYASYINDIYNQYASKGVHFYFVSVNPTNGNYSHLSSGIQDFNKNIKSSLNSKIKYIDTYSYLVSNGFNTGDGLHYTNDTYKKIYNYVLKSL